MNANVSVAGVPLPDGRVDLYARRKRTGFVFNGQAYDRVFCVNCGVEGGAVYKDCPVFYLCNDCVDKWGPPPGAVELEVK